MRLARSASAVVVLTSCAFVAGCTDPLPADPIDVSDAVTRGLCLAQIHNDVEVITLDGRSFQVRVPLRPSDGRFLSEGIVTNEGTLILSISDTGGEDPEVVSLRTDGASLWRWPARGPVGHRVAVSPDGKRMVFPSDGGFAVLDLDTHVLTRLPVSGRRPSWDHTGTRIAYDDEESVGVYDLRTGTNTMLGRGRDAAWLPGGTSLAINDRAHSVAIVDIRTRERRPFLSRRHVRTPRWSPDGRWMAYSYLGDDLPWWSLGKAAEIHQVVLRDARTGAERSVGAYAKANPGEYDWVWNRVFCSGDRELKASQER